MSDVYDRAVWIALGIDIAHSNQKTRDLLDRFLGCGESNPLQWFLSQGRQTLDAESEMRAAPIVRNGMDLIENDGANRFQHLPAGVGGEQEIKGFRCRDQNVRRGFD